MAHGVYIQHRVYKITITCVLKHWRGDVASTSTSAMYGKWPKRPVNQNGQRWCPKRPTATSKRPPPSSHNDTSIIGIHTSRKPCKKQHSTSLVNYWGSPGQEDGGVVRKFWGGVISPWGECRKLPAFSWYSSTMSVYRTEYIKLRHVCLNTKK